MRNSVETRFTSYLYEYEILASTGYAKYNQNACQVFLNVPHKIQLKSVYSEVKVDCRQKVNSFRLNATLPIFIVILNLFNI